MASSCQVFFRVRACDLDTASRLLSEVGLTVTRHGDELTARRPGSPKFRILLATGAWVQAEAAEVSAGSPHAAAMRECDARFEVSVESLDESLDEVNTLMEVQGTLQDASEGFLFLPWNGNLSGPWQG